jgi:hypothetical protein
VVPSNATAATYVPEPAGFCREQTVHDFLRPMQRMPKLNSPLPDGTLPFAPPTLRLKVRERLLLTEDYAGYGALINRRSPELPLFWRVRTTLSRIDWKGRKLETIRSSRKRVDIVTHRDGFGFGHWMGKEDLGPYRLTTVVYDRHGRRIGGFGFYLRVVKSTMRPRLRLNATAYRPGETVFGRFENYGTVPFEVDWGFRIQRFDGSRWSPVPAEAALPDGFSPPPAGMTTRCAAFDIPPQTPPGRYRMSRGWTLAVAPEDFEGPDAGKARAEFTILP